MNYFGVENLFSILYYIHSSCERLQIYQQTFNILGVDILPKIKKLLIKKKIIMNAGQDGVRTSP